MPRRLRWPSPPGDLPFSLASQPSPPQRPSDFKRMRATELYCPQCQRAQEVRERLLLVLPGVDLYEYYCSACNTPLGQRKTEGD